MGRKRLLTILAAVTAAVTLQVGPAAATEDCLELGIDILTLDAADAEDCVIDPLTGEILKEAEALDDPVDDTTETVGDAVEKTTDTVTKATTEVTDTVTGGGSGSPAPAPAPTDPPPAPGDDTGTAPGGTSGGDTRSSGGTTTATTNQPGVSASGGARRPAVSDPARDSQLAALRAIREDLAASSWADRGMAGPVSPFGGLSGTDLDLAAPQVADSGVEPEFGERLTPEVAVASDDQDALLATSSPVTDLAEAPLALKILAAALVLGAGAVWTIASRELGKGSAGTA